MNTQDQIKAIAELAGEEKLKIVVETFYKWPTQIDYCLRHLEDRGCGYLTSRDAIVPVIEKLPPGSAIDLTHYLWKAIESDAEQNYNLQYNVWRLILATPAQLCEALLRATGKWVE